MELFPQARETKAQKLLDGLGTLWRQNPNEKIVIFATYLGTVDLIGKEIAPGFLFGLMAYIYYIHSQEEEGRKKLLACVILITGIICYGVAFWITVRVTFVASDNALVNVNAPIGAAIGGFVATLFFISVLQSITKRYSGSLFTLSLWGGLIGALFVDVMVYPLSIDRTIMDKQPLMFVLSAIFFIGWQTIMLFLLSQPLHSDSLDHALLKG